MNVSIASVRQGLSRINQETVSRDVSPQAAVSVSVNMPGLFEKRLFSITIAMLLMRSRTVDSMCFGMLCNMSPYISKNCCETLNRCCPEFQTWLLPLVLQQQGGLIGPFGPPAGPNRLIGGNLYGTTGGTMPLGPVAIPNAMMEEIRRRQFEVGSGPQGPPSGSNQGGVMPLTPSSTTSVANQLDMPSKNNLMMWPTVSLNQSMFPSQTGTAPYPSSAGGQLNRTKLSLASV